MTVVISAVLSENCYSAERHGTLFSASLPVNKALPRKANYSWDIANNRIRTLKINRCSLGESKSHLNKPEREQLSEAERDRFAELTSILRQALGSRTAADGLA
jgi:hypothetical protein